MSVKKTAWQIALTFSPTEKYNKTRSLGAIQTLVKKRTRSKTHCRRRPLLYVFIIMFVPPVRPGVGQSYVPFLNAGVYSRRNRLGVGKFNSEQCVLPATRDPTYVLYIVTACTVVLGGLCDYAKFGCNRCRNFDSMQILIFCTLSLKMPIHAPKIGVLGDFAPKMGSSMNEIPKRHILGRKHVVRRIDRQNRTTYKP